jgi:hypothetical protein
MPRRPNDAHDRTLRLELRLSAEELAQLEAGAAADGAAYLGSWARDLLLRAAGRSVKRAGSRKSDRGRKKATSGT